MILDTTELSQRFSVFRFTISNYNPYVHLQYRFRPLGLLQNGEKSFPGSQCSYDPGGIQHPYRSKYPKALMIRSILKVGLINAIMVIQLFFMNPSLRGSDNKFDQKFSYEEHPYDINGGFLVGCKPFYHFHYK